MGRICCSDNATSVVLNEDIRIALPKLPEQLVSIEQDQGETYFIHDAPPETEDQSRRQVERPYFGTHL